jgi:hypothetical protein
MMMGSVEDEGKIHDASRSDTPKRHRITLCRTTTTLQQILQQTHHTTRTFKPSAAPNICTRVLTVSTGYREEIMTPRATAPATKWSFFAESTCAKRASPVGFGCGLGVYEG